ncbi:mobile mystery protein B [Alphaproteobacteria bacterium]|nr:mobile mystery protein B [Alphaproteobacteria bacterium]
MEDLIPSYITNRQELNAAEQQNILNAKLWAYGQRRNVLSEKFLKRLHKRMFQNVWRWAGHYRKTARNIGIEPYRVGMELNALIENVTFWIENKTYSFDEIAARFHHQLVLIHPFPNGNGRWSRLATDLLLVAHGCHVFTWGGRGNLTDVTERRKRYIDALRAADNHDIQPLLVFVRL